MSNKYDRCRCYEYVYVNEIIVTHYMLHLSGEYFKEIPIQVFEKDADRLGRFFVNFESAVTEWSEHAKRDPPADPLESPPEEQAEVKEKDAVEKVADEE